MSKKIVIALTIIVLMVSCAIEPTAISTELSLESSGVQNTVKPQNNTSPKIEVPTIKPSVVESPIIEQTPIVVESVPVIEEPTEESTIESPKIESPVVEQTSIINEPTAVIEPSTSKIEESSEIEQTSVTPKIESTQKYISYSAPLNGQCGNLVTIYYRMCNSKAKSIYSVKYQSIDYGEQIPLEDGADIMTIYAIDEDGYEWGQWDRPIVNTKDNFEFKPALMEIELGVDVSRVTVNPPSMFTNFKHKDFSEGTTLKYMFDTFINHRMILMYDDGVNVWAADHLFVNDGTVKQFTIGKGSRLSLINSTPNSIVTSGKYQVLEVGGKPYEHSDVIYTGVAFDPDWIVQWNREDGDTDADTSMLVSVELICQIEGVDYTCVEEVYVPACTWLKYEITWTPNLN